MRITDQYWPGVLVGVGIGLMCGPAFVELEWLTPNHKVWAFLVGLILFGVGNGLSRYIRRGEITETTNRP